VAEVRSREGEREIVLVHVEVQSEPESDFGKRMFEYYTLLWLHYDAPIVPVVLYLKGGDPKGVHIVEYRHALFGREWVRFRFASVALARLSAREYLKANPLGAALGALMSRPKGSENLELRARMLKRVVESGLDPGRQLLLVTVIETYFRLSDEERTRFRRLVSRKEYGNVQDVELTWADELRLEGKREALKRLLAAKFGPLSAMVEAQVDRVSAETLDQYLDRVITAAALEDLGLVG
jgi:hypothetical protein